MVLHYNVVQCVCVVHCLFACASPDSSPDHKVKPVEKGDVGVEDKAKGTQPH